MSGDTEVLYAIKDLGKDLKLGPKILLGYNAADDLVEMKKVVNGVTYVREIDDPDVADKVVAKWIEYGSWSAT